MTAPVALVTGITGQDGGYLAEHLVADGWIVHGLVQSTDDRPEHLRALGTSVSLHEGDLLDHARLSDVVRDTTPTAIWNLAGISSVARSWSEPVLTAQTNGTAVAALLQAALALQDATGRPVTFVQASSAEIFSGSSTVPQDESTPLAPRSPYGAAKAFAHHLVQTYRGRGLAASNAILYNHESPRRPVTFVTRKITTGVAAIATGRARELVLGDRTVRRDWGWAPDYVAAMVALGGAAEPQDVVIASGASHSVDDFVAAAFARVGIEDWEHLVRTDDRLLRTSDAADLVGDPARARSELGWTPTVGFEDIVGRMVDADLARLVRDEATDHLP